MDITTLRTLQKPLKDSYRADPGAAIVRLSAEGRLEGEGLTCTVSTWAGPARAGLHPSAAGDGSDACSGDMLLQAVAACAGVTLRSVALATGVELRDARVIVEGDFDARGTLGVDRETPVGLTDVRITLAFETDADEAAVERLVALTERYCVVAQTLAHPPRLSVVRAGA